MATREGFYAMYYRSTASGVTGTGMGMLVLDSGIVIGCDVAGGIYDGTYEFNPRTDMLDMKVTARIPAGAVLVTGVPAQAVPLVFDIEESLPRQLDAKHPATVTVPGRDVVVVFHKLRDFPS
jgi:hypothetical protein